MHNIINQACITDIDQLASYLFQYTIRGAFLNILHNF